MKQLLTPYQVMQELVKTLNKAYLKKTKKTEGVIQFYLTHKKNKINCYLQVNYQKLVLHEGIYKNPTVTLTSSFYNWLDLASKRLNPVWGVITKKLKFKGNTSLFSKILQMICLM